MKYPLMPGQTVEYLVLHALESNMVDVWGIRKHLLLKGPGYMLWPRQISGALQRLKRDGIVKHLNAGERDRWTLVHNCQGKRRRCFSAVRLTDVLCVTEVK